MRIGWRVGVSALIAATVVALAAVVGVNAEHSGRDDAFSISRFERVVDVAPDGTTEVVETIDVVFHESRRGIYRDLPDQLRFPSRTWGVESIDTGDPTQEWNYSVERDGSTTRIRIGDPDVWLEPGDYRYRLRLQAPTFSHVLTSDPDLVETRIDIPGFQWPTTIDDVALEVRLPGPIVHSVCVEGRVGARQHCATSPTISDNEYALQLGPYAPFSAATIAVHVPSDAFDDTLPNYAPTPLGAGTGLEPLDIGGSAAALLLVSLLALPLLILDLVYARVVYRDRVTDEHLHHRVHPHAAPSPPAKFRAPEVAGLLSQFNTQGLFLATLVDLEQRGYLRTSLSGDTTGKRQTLTVARVELPSDANDRRFMQALLGSADTIEFDGSYDAAVAKKVTAATRHVLRRARNVYDDHGYTHSSGILLRSTAFKVFLAMAVLLWTFAMGGAMSAVSVLPGWASTIIAVLVLGGWGLAHLPWRHHRIPLNSQGRDIAAHARSFRTFVATVEGDQLNWAAGQPGIDHRHPAVALLPYAIALGLADSWFKRFGAVLAQFAGASDTSGSEWWAASSTYAAVRTTQSATTTPPSSSGSGGGGAGSGGGGGGGGSW